MLIFKCDDETSRQRVRFTRELRQLERSKASLLKKDSEQHIGIRCRRMVCQVLLLQS